MDIWTDIMGHGHARMTARADRIRHWLDRKESNEADWVEVVLGLIEELTAARAEFAANREFAIWLMDNGLERLDPHDRTACISLGADMRLARVVLKETGSRYLRHVWEEAKSRYESARLGACSITPLSPTISPIETSPEPIEAEPIEPISRISKPAAALLFKAPSKSNSSLVAKFGPEVGGPIAVYLGKQTRTIMHINKVLKKREAQVFAAFLRDTPNLPTPINSLSRLGLSTLWPKAPHALIRSVERGKDEIEVFVNVLLAWPTKVASVLAEWNTEGQPVDTNLWYAKKHPHLDHRRPAASTPEEIAAWQASVEAIDHAATGKPRHDPSCRAAHRGPIRHHGVDIWPAPPFASYNFDEAWFVTTMWLTIDKPLRRAEANARTRASWFFKPFQGCLGNLNPAAGEVLARLLDAQSEHPDATDPDDNVCPPYDSVQ